MDPGQPNCKDLIGTVVTSLAGHDKGELFYVIGSDDLYLLLVNGKDRTPEKPKRKKRKHAAEVLHSETRVAEKIRGGEKVLNSELRRDLAYICQKMQTNDL